MKNLIYKYNKKEFEEMNIHTWHKQGFTGKNVVGGNVERCSYDHPYFNDKVKFNIGRTYNSTYENGHGNSTMLIIHGIVPDAELEVLDDRVTGSERKMLTDTLPLVEKRKITSINASRSYVDTHADVTKKVRELKEHNYFKPVNSSGNNGLSGSTAVSDDWIVCGAAIIGKKGYERASWSSIGEEVDFSTLYIKNVPDFRKGKEDRTIRVSGTSFAAPVLTGLILLIDDFFIQKTGLPLTFDKMYQFLKDHAVDSGDPGKDVEFGHGVIILPNPEDIDIDKYKTVVKEDKPEVEKPKPEAKPKPKPKPEEDKKPEVEERPIIEPEKPITETPKPDLDKGKINIDSIKDVNKSHWFYVAVDFCISTGLMTGYEDNTFKPNNNINRAEIASVITKLDKNSNVKVKRVKDIDLSKELTDIDVNRWYAPFIKYCIDRELMNGRGNKFDPMGDLSRAEMCQILYNIDKKLNINNSKYNLSITDYKDINKEKWYYDPIKYCLESGYVLGYTDKDVKVFLPDNSLTRAELSSILFNKYRNIL